MNIKKSVQMLTPQLIAWRRDLHHHPESAWTEFRTTSLVAQHLRSLGLTPHLGAAAVHPEKRRGLPDAATLENARRHALAHGADPALVALMGDGLTGVWAEVDSGREGPLLAVRVDMDALPLTECTEGNHAPQRVGFASCQPECMHACGHDAHTALGLGLASLLTQTLALQAPLWCGRVRLIFQPAEEGTRGARALCAAGVLDNVDYLLGVHVGLAAEETGHVICGAANFLATTKLDVDFSGAPAHAGAAPHMGRNALLAACSATLALHGLPRHGQGDTRIGVGTLLCRHPRNVVPDSAHLELETRGASGDLNHWLEQEARRVISESAALWNCEARIHEAGHAPHASSDLSVAREVEAAARQCADATRITLRADLGASEDFSLLLRTVQQNKNTAGRGAMLLLGCSRSGGHHTSTFDLDEKVLPLGLEVLARTALRLLARSDRA